MPHYSAVLRSKLPATPLSIFSRMSRLAAAEGAINLSQGFPDFDTPPELIEKVYEAMKAGHNQYAPMEGVLALRESIARSVEDWYGAVYHPEKEITITAGATQALFTAISAFVHEGDEVILFEPAYDSYAPAVRLNGGVPIHIALDPTEFSYDWEWVKRSISQRTKMIIINSPHNPSGKMITAEDWAHLYKLVRNNDIILVSDEVYEHIVFDGRTHLSAAAHAELRDRSIIVSSFGKTFHTTGWKTGYVLAPEELMVEFRKVHQFNVFAVNTPIQHALTHFIKDKSWFPNLSSFYQNKRDTFLSLMKDSRFKLVPSEGTYFQIADYSQISDKKDLEFAEWLTKQGVATIPLSPFYHKSPDTKLIRFCFAKRDETLEKAADVLCKI